MEQVNNTVRKESADFANNLIGFREEFTANQIKEKSILNTCLAHGLDATKISVADYLRKSISNVKSITKRKSKKRLRSSKKEPSKAIRKKNVINYKKEAKIKIKKGTGKAEKEGLERKAARFNESINELSRGLSRQISDLFEANKQEKNSRKLVKKNQVYDSESLDEDEEAGSAEISVTFSKNSKFLFYWEHFISLLVLYSITVIPYLQVFDKEHLSGLFVFHTIIDVSFLLDIVFCFFTPVTLHDSHGKAFFLVSNREIAIHYLCGQFLLDLISAVPVNLIMLHSSEDSSVASLLRVTKFYRLFKWFRVFRMTKLMHGKNHDRLNSQMQSLSDVKYFRILKIVAVLILFLHVGACIYLFIALQVDLDANWIIRSKFSHYSESQLYVASFYFCVTTVLGVGYGDITSKTLTERSFNVVFMILGVFLFSCLVSAVSKIFYEIDEKSHKMEEYMNVLTALDRKYHIPNKLYSKILNTLRFSVKRDYSEIYKLSEDLPAGLKTKFIMSIHTDQVKHLHFFHKKPLEFISTAIMMVRSQLVSKGEVLVPIGSYLDEMFLITKGSVYLTMGSYYDNIKIAVLRQNYSFGDVLLHVNGQSPYEVKAKAETVSLMTLSSSQFVKLRNSFEEEVSQIVGKNLEIFEVIERRRKVILELFKCSKDKEELKQAIKVFDHWVLKRTFEKEIKTFELDELILNHKEMLASVINELQIEHETEAKFFERAISVNKEVRKVIEHMSERDKEELLSSQIMKISKFAKMKKEIENVSEGHSTLGLNLDVPIITFKRSISKISEHSFENESLEEPSTGKIKNRPMKFKSEIYRTSTTKLPDMKLTYPKKYEIIVSKDETEGLSRNNEKEHDKILIRMNDKLEDVDCLLKIIKKKRNRRQETSNK